MKFLPLLAFACGAFASVAAAQEQEKGMLDRIDANWKSATDAMNANVKKKKGPTSGALVSPLSNKQFESGALATKKFDATSYGGLKGADIKSYDTRSFFGLKNPWLGRKIYDTPESSFSRRSAPEAQEKFKTDAFAVKDFTKGGKADTADAASTVSPADQPRPYLVAGKAQAGVDKFTQNLQKELTIDDVRDLLNKGHGE